jgi:hypothetical protein
LSGGNLRGKFLEARVLWGKVTKAYLDNCIESGRIRTDLQPPSEMDAVRSLLNARDECRIEIVTSRESWREQDRTKDPIVRAQLAEARGDTPVVQYDHKLLGFHNQMDHLGTIAVTPLITEIVDERLFTKLTAAGLKEADARHLMYAVKNECEWFVTTDPHFTSRVPQLETLCDGVRIVKPSELAAQLSKPRKKMKPEDIEKSVKRPLSDAEIIAVSRLRTQLPKDRRKQKRMLRRAREKARREELGSKAQGAQR